MNTEDNVAFDPELSAAETKSNAFYGANVPQDDLTIALVQFIDAANKLDKIKKALFYGRAYESQRSNLTGEVPHNLEMLPFIVKPDQPVSGVDMIHCILGKMTEASELGELLYKSITAEHPLDVVGYVEEIGDSRWYDRIGLPAVGYSCRRADVENYSKLSAKATAKNPNHHARFANGFSEHEAIVRDLPAERLALEQRTNSQGLPADIQLGETITQYERRKLGEQRAQEQLSQVDADSMR